MAPPCRASCICARPCSSRSSDPEAPIALLTVYADIICPYCYLAEQSELRELLDRVELSWDWKGYEIHPELPSGGVDTRVLPEHLRRARREELKGLAAARGIPLGSVRRVGNSRRVLAMLELARDRGLLHPFRERVSRAYWQESADLADDALLARLAAEVGLPPEETVAAGDAPRYRERVAAHREEALELGVSGVPAFVFNGYPLLGLQPLATLERVARRTLRRAT